MVRAFGPGEYSMLGIIYSTFFYLGIQSFGKSD